MNAKVTCFEPGSHVNHTSFNHVPNVKVEQRAAGELDAQEEYDVIIAIESAFHYPQRSEFFKAARRALKPGGLFIVTDLPLSDEPSDFLFNPRRSVSGWMLTRAMNMPKENYVSLSTYRSQLDEVSQS